MTYQVTRWRKTDDGDTWRPLWTGLTKERAEALVEAAKWDLRFSLLRLRVEEEP